MCYEQHIAADLVALTVALPFYNAEYLFCCKVDIIII